MVEALYMMNRVRTYCDIPHKLNNVCFYEMFMPLL
uniref:Uncharacterized protein n=1 Tax=Rhizophora mucronata TaxID=61149 RepID=A0A2P2NUY4_RHIMU